MRISTGRHYLAIPGPSVIPDRVLNAMHRASVDVYKGDIVTVTESLKADVKRLVHTAHDVAMYICNGHGTWEAAASNLFSRGDKVLVLVLGQFGLFWADSMRRQGLDVIVADFGRQDGVAVERLAKILDDDRDQSIRAVCVTHVETSTSVKVNIPSIREVMSAARHPALLICDTIASLGCDEYRMDSWGVDVTLAASQKGLMLPPGLGILCFSERARAASKRADLLTPHWDWTDRADGEFYLRFFGTPPTQLLFGLRESLTMILDEEGLAQVWSRHATLARSVWQAFDTWAVPSQFEINVKNPSMRAAGVTSAMLSDGRATALREWLETNAGVTLGVGLGMKPADDYLRVAHMGHVNPHMTLGLLASMEAGMQALGIEHGMGAVEAAAGIVAASAVVDAREHVSRPDFEPLPRVAGLRK
jgi:alanine-glyoxylate transaminase/serine-glyoxylate transaminase/serine-pyruvate transaminase